MWIIPLETSILTFPFISLTLMGALFVLNKTGSKVFNGILFASWIYGLVLEAVL